MPMESDYLDLMHDQVGIEPFLSRDKWSKPTYGPKVLYQCRVQGTDREIRQRDGSTVVASAVVYPFLIPAGLTDDARITMPDGSQPAIAGIIRESDSLGPHHVEIYVGAPPPRV